MALDVPSSLATPDGSRVDYRVSSPSSALPADAPTVLLLQGLASNLTRFSEFTEFTSLRQSCKGSRIDPGAGTRVASSCSAPFPWRRCAKWRPFCKSTRYKAGPR